MEDIERPAPKPFIKTFEQYEFLQKLLDNTVKGQSEINVRNMFYGCDGCTTCCLQQSPTSSLADAFLVAEYIFRQKQEDVYIPRLKKYLSVYRWSGLAVEKHKLLYQSPCPFLGVTGCMVWAGRPTVCRAFNYTREGSGACENRRNPGLRTKEAQDWVFNYMDARKEFERLFLNGSEYSIALLPAAVYSIMVGADVVNYEVAHGEIVDENFMLLKRNDAKEYRTFIKSVF